MKQDDAGFSASDLVALAGIVLGPVLLVALGAFLGPMLIAAFGHPGG